MKAPKEKNSSFVGSILVVNIQVLGKIISDIQIQHITPCILHIALKLCISGFGAWENLLWHPFDD